MNPCFRLSEKERWRKTCFTMSFILNKFIVWRIGRKFVLSGVAIYIQASHFQKDNVITKQKIVCYEYVFHCSISCSYRWHPSSTRK